MKVRTNHPYIMKVDYRPLDKLPKVWDEWIEEGYKDSYIFYIRCVNDRIVETAADNYKLNYDFYDIYIGMDEDTFIEHICIRKDENAEV